MLKLIHQFGSDWNVSTSHRLWCHLFHVVLRGSSYSSWWFSDFYSVPSSGQHLMTFSFSFRAVLSAFLCCFVCLQPVKLSDHRGRLCFSGWSCDLQPLPSERADTELQPSRRLRSEAADGCTEGSTQTQVWRGLLQPHTMSDRGGRAGNMFSVLHSALSFCFMLVLSFIWTYM